ncbi:MAG TPA: redoxin family protein [Candidatus Angelobacter sp.]|jgi:thiol-disulfide isomerase/thioredoxin
MKKYRHTLLVAFVIICLIQVVPANAATDEALALLKQAGQRYAKAKAYRIEAITETSSTSELSREWQKSFATVAEEPGNRFRYEVRSANADSIRISDGKTEWIYRVAEKAYTQHPTSADGPAISQNVMFADMEESHTMKMRKTLADETDAYQSAQSLPDEILTFNGVKVPCSVIKAGTNDLKKPAGAGTVSEKTFWIDKSTGAIRKIVAHDHGPKMMAPGFTEDTDTTELYPVVQLDTQLPDSIFTFAPPQTAKLVEKFKDPFGGEDLTGQPAPAFTFKSEDNKEMSLASLRGKPVILEFWATWCLPCVASMPEMAELYKQTRDKGLVLISVDEDEDAKVASDFLAKKNNPWPNFHDLGDIKKAFSQTALPYTLLIDPEGKIVFSKIGSSDDSLSDLRAAIAKLGPEFASVAQPTPAATTK